MKRFRPAAVLIFAAVYFFSARIGLSLAFVNESATAFWPPTGLSLAALLLFGTGLWSGVFLGAFLANLATPLPVWVAFAIACGNTLEAVAGAALTRRFAGGTAAFEKPSTIASFVALAAFLSTLLSAGIGTATLALSGRAASGQLGQILFTWWLGDATSNLILAPLLLTWCSGSRRLPPVKRLVEAFALIAVSCLSAKIVFGGWFPADVKNYPLEYVVMPILVWAAFRFDGRIVAAAAAAFAGFAVAGTLSGSGPFATADANASLLLLQSFAAVVTVTALTLSALVSEMRLAADELREKNKELEQFAYIASHDLQEPLRKIITFAERLNDAPPGEEEAKDYLQRMDTAARRMKSTIEDLLRFSRAVRGDEPFEPLNLNALLDEVKSDLEIAVSSSGARLEIGPLPAIRGNRAQIRHVFQNLISNSIKFAKPGIPPRVRVTGSRTPDGIVIRVEDEGIGFDPQHSEKIFRLFQRLHARDEYEGSGIGLSIVRKIVQNHSGSIRAESSTGAGAKFVLRFPQN